MSDNSTLDRVLERLEVLESIVGVGPPLTGFSPQRTQLPLTPQDEIWLTRRQQARRWNVTIRTVERWGKDPKVGLPSEIEINGRRSRALSAIERFERSRIKKTV